MKIAISEEVRNDLINCMAQLRNNERKGYLGINDHNNQEVNKIRFSVLNIKSKIFEQIRSSQINTNNEALETLRIKKVAENLSVRFFDNFNSPQAWWEGNKWFEGKCYDAKRNNVWIGDVEIKNNRMLVYSDKENLVDNGIKTSKRVYINEYHDYVLEVGANPDPRYCGYETGWSFLWGKSDSDNFYSITIYPEKKIARIAYRFGGNRYIILDDKKFLFIDNYNTVKIIKAEKNTYFFINEELIHKNKVYSFFGNRIGLFAINGQIAFDYVRISY